MFNNGRLGVTEWEVETAISGPITVGERSLELQVEKGEQNPFTTTVTISKASHGCRCVLIARAFDQQNANDAAVYFVGQALDVLSLRLRTPLYLNMFRPKFRSTANHVKRFVTREELFDAFTDGRNISIHRRYLSRAISWYRKGQVSEVPIDRLIAFWSALEAIGSNHFRHTPRTERGAVNQVCDCFDQLWGPVTEWKVIPNQPEVINQFHNYRNDIAHGIRRVDIETIREVVGYLALYENLAHQFLLDWMQNGIVFEQREPVNTASS